MKFFVLLYKRYPQFIARLVLLGILMAVGRLIVIQTINTAMLGLLGGSPLSYLHASIAVGSLLALFIMQPYFYTTSSKFICNWIAEYRQKVGKKIQKASLLSIENIGFFNFMEVIANQTSIISFNIISLILFPQAVLEWLVITIFAGFLISPSISIILTLSTIGLIMAVTFLNIRFRNLEKHLFGLLQEYSRSLNDLILGHKELKVNHLKQIDLQKKQKEILEEFSSLIPSYMVQVENVQFYTKIINYALLGFLVFVLPALIGWTQQQSLQIAIIVMFVMMPLQKITMQWSALPFINEAIDKIIGLEENLEKYIIEEETHKTMTPLTFQEQIELKNITFTYVDNAGVRGYSLGPINLSLIKGEILFIVGGNGSGKSTLLKVLTGLYHHSDGEILVDGSSVKGTQIESYRELFAALYTDHFLSQELLGVEKVNKAKVKRLLKLFQLSEKTKIVGNRFTNINLSTGQKKRLAMVTAFLENKEVYIFDEVAADQDPGHRKLFYNFILPDIKLAGKTCIVVSHDDHYFHTADRILEMKKGKLTPYTTAENQHQPNNNLSNSI